MDAPYVTPAEASAAEAIAALKEELAFFDDWLDRYEQVIDWGRALPPFPAAWREPSRRVEGCQSQVWLASRLADGRLWLAGASDAAIVQGLVAMLLRIYSGRTPEEILAVLGARLTFAVADPDLVEAALEDLREHSAPSAGSWPSLASIGPPLTGTQDHPHVDASDLIIVPADELASAEHEALERRDEPSGESDGGLVSAAAEATPVDSELTTLEPLVRSAEEAIATGVAPALEVAAGTASSRWSGRSTRGGWVGSTGDWPQRHGVGQPIRSHSGCRAAPGVSSLQGPSGLVGRAAEQRGTAAQQGEGSACRPGPDWPLAGRIAAARHMEQPPCWHVGHATHPAAPAATRTG